MALTDEEVRRRLGHTFEQMNAVTGNTILVCEPSSLHAVSLRQRLPLPPGQPAATWQPGAAQAAQRSLAGVPARQAHARAAPAQRAMHSLLTSFLTTFSAPAPPACTSRCATTCRTQNTFFTAYASCAAGGCEGGWRKLAPSLHHTLTARARSFRLRVVLCSVDVAEVPKPLGEVNKICALNACSLVCAWSHEEAARYLETFKLYEHKTAESIQERTETDYLSRLTGARRCHVLCSARG
jgi:hypothetical protein